MAFDSIKAMVTAQKETNRPLWELIMESQLQECGGTREAFLTKMMRLWNTMLEVSKTYRGERHSYSGLTGGNGDKLEKNSPHLAGDFMTRVMAEAIKQTESNACMRVIVAAPTAGSCGVLPAVLIPTFQDGHTQEEMIRALIVAAGVGQVIAHRASISGAEGGCQAEIGSASAMAAAALVMLHGGTPEQMDHAVAIALSNLLGLVCDPVAGLVEIPCINRNTMGAANAVCTADMALAGIESRIPADEIIDIMKKVGQQLPPSLRETGEGGVAATPTGKRIAKKLRTKE